MLTILLVSLFIVLTVACIALLHHSLSQDGPVELHPQPDHRSRDPFAPILRAGADTDDITTVKMLGGVR